MNTLVLDLAPASSSSPSLLLALLLAHLLGDFVLQPDRWVADRQARGIRSPSLALHALVHAVLAWLALCALQSVAGIDDGIDATLAAMMLGLAHWTIDAAKAKATRRWPTRQLGLFMLDQGLRGATIVVVWLWLVGSLSPLTAMLAHLSTPSSLLLLLAYLLVTRPMAVAIALAMAPLARQLKAPGTLDRAGARIGILERLLVLTLTLLDQLTAVGFLLAAMSVLRFGDLKESRDRKLTEYVLLGTLASVTSTLVLGLLVRLWLGGQSG